MLALKRRNASKRQKASSVTHNTTKPLVRHSSSRYFKINKRNSGTKSLNSNGIRHFHGHSANAVFSSQETVTKNHQNVQQLQSTLDCSNTSPTTLELPNPVKFAISAETIPSQSEGYYPYHPDNHHLKYSNHNVIPNWEAYSKEYNLNLNPYGIHEPSSYSYHLGSALDKLVKRFSGISHTDHARRLASLTRIRKDDDKDNDKNNDKNDFDKNLEKSDNNNNTNLSITIDLKALFNQGKLEHNKFYVLSDQYINETKRDTQKRDAESKLALPIERICLVDDNNITACTSPKSTTITRFELENALYGPNILKKHPILEITGGISEREIEKDYNNVVIAIIHSAIITANTIETLERALVQHRLPLYCYNTASCIDSAYIEWDLDKYKNLAKSMGNGTSDDTPNQRYVDFLAERFFQVNMRKAMKDKFNHLLNFIPSLGFTSIHDENLDQLAYVESNNTTLQYNIDALYAQLGQVIDTTGIYKKRHSSSNHYKTSQQEVIDSSTSSDSLPRGNSSIDDMITPESSKKELEWKTKLIGSGPLFIGEIDAIRTATDTLYRSIYNGQLWLNSTNSIQWQEYYQGDFMKGVERIEGLLGEMSQEPTLSTMQIEENTYDNTDDSLISNNTKISLNRYAKQQNKDHPFDRLTRNQGTYYSSFKDVDDEVKRMAAVSRRKSSFRKHNFFQKLQGRNDAPFYEPPEVTPILGTLARVLNGEMYRDGDGYYREVGDPQGQLEEEQPGKEKQPQKQQTQPSQQPSQPSQQHQRNQNIEDSTQQQNIANQKIRKSWSKDSIDKEQPMLWPFHTNLAYPYSFNTANQMVFEMKYDVAKSYCDMYEEYLDEKMEQLGDDSEDWKVHCEDGENNNMTAKSAKDFTRNDKKNSKKVRKSFRLQLPSFTADEMIKKISYSNPIPPTVFSGDKPPKPITTDMIDLYALLDQLTPSGDLNKNNQEPLQQQALLHITPPSSFDTADMACQNAMNHVQKSSNPAPSTQSLENMTLIPKDARKIELPYIQRSMINFEQGPEFPQTRPIWTNCTLIDSNGNEMSNKDENKWDGERCAEKVVVNNDENNGKNKPTLPFAHKINSPSFSSLPLNDQWARTSLYRTQDLLWMTSIGFVPEKMKDEEAFDTHLSWFFLPYFFGQVEKLTFFHVQNPLSPFFSYHLMALDNIPTVKSIPEREEKGQFMNIHENIH